MFEKEAKERAEEIEANQTLGVYDNDEDFARDEGWNDGYVSEYEDGFKDGAEFGYNKANEDKWHDLRKNPNDLPTKEQLGKTFVVAFAFNEKTQKYYSFDCAEYIDKGKFITHTVNVDNENNSYKVIAWKEITQPKED